MSHENLPRLSRSDVANALDARQDSAESGVDPSSVDQSNAGSTVIGVLLAAGGSSRFGDANKLLADLNGEALVCHAARTLSESSLPQVVVVLGHEADAVRAAIVGADIAEHLDVTFVVNHDYEQGLSTSVQAGVDSVRAADADAAVFLPGDIPAVDSGTVDLLVDAYRTTLADAIAAGYRTERGNPVLFDRAYFEALDGLTGDVGGRSVLLESERAAVVETDDPGVRRDIDTRADLERRR